MVDNTPPGKSRGPGGPREPREQKDIKDLETLEDLENLKGFENLTLEPYTSPRFELKTPLC